MSPLDIQICVISGFSMAKFTSCKVVSLPNLQIIDFSYGHTGSTHDSIASDETCLAQQHETLPDGGEFV